MIAICNLLGGWSLNFSSGSIGRRSLSARSLIFRPPDFGAWEYLKLFLYEDNLT